MLSVDACVLDRYKKRLLLNYHTRFKISRIQSCKLKNIGVLDFEFESGACNTFSLFGILLCFPKNDMHACFSMDFSNSDIYSIKEAESSSFPHTRVPMGSYKNMPFVTGGYGLHKKTELFDVQTMKWKRKSDYPQGEYTRYPNTSSISIFKNLRSKSDRL